jgi:hypothetical protein
LPKKHEESPKVWIRFASTTNLQHNQFEPPQKSPKIEASRFRQYIG